MKRVIIIEDNPVVAAIYRRALCAHDFEVDVAPDGLAGLERLGEVGADGILLDLMLPKLSGLDVLRAIRAHEACHSLPVMVMTAAAVPALVDQAMEAGANRVFNKATTNPLAVVGAFQEILRNSTDASLVT